MRVMAWEIIPKKLQNVWEEWNLRVAVLLSLTFQIILIFVSSARKRSGSLLINSVVWSSYLIADWIAAFAVGLISNSQGEKCEKATVDDSLAAFWAPFLLLHLGGPDTITAFSLEDNELWLRHMLNVVAQVFAVGYVFLQSQPNTFWLPTGLVCLVGTIKYAERTRSLYLACLGNLKDSLRPKPDPGPNYAQLMEEYSSNRAAGVPEQIHRVPEPPKKAAEPIRDTSKEEARIQFAYWFYDKFRGLIVDHMFSFHERNESREFFFSLDAKAAFRLMEVELNFLYDALYTKMAAVHNGVFAYILRFACSALLVAAFVLFASHHKPHIHPFDRNITYALLAGAIVLDFVALVKVVFSDWTIALVKHSRALSLLGLQSLLLKLNVPAAALAVRRVMSFRRRWSNCMCQHNLIRYCLKKRYKLVDKTAEHFAIKELLDKFLSTKQEVDQSLEKFIFAELKEKAKKAEDTKFAKNIYSARGEWTLPDDYDTLVHESVSEVVEYDESVLMWHIATDICYYKNQNNQSAKENRTRCKHLSDYMLYLLIMQPKLMLSVAGIASIRFQDTCAEARKFFGRSREKMEEEHACDMLINVDTPVKPVEVKGDRSKSLLFDAVSLAKKLNEKVQEKPGEAWETMSKVWLELLCYGASHCRGDAHAQQIRQGGELITFVWLLMSHFGLGEQFRIDAGHARAKLVIEK